MARFMWNFLVIVGLVVIAEGQSDEFGRNPQHDFGSVVGKKLNNVLPFWTMLGDAFANENFVRLTPDRQSKTGGVWNSQPMLWGNWEVMVQFNINGIGGVGADGLAWWLAKEVNVIGDFFGFREKFHGIGVTIDTYDNDGSGQHPIVNLLQNNGYKTYAHSHDGGLHHASDMEIGHCSYSLRNQKENTIMKITYIDNTIEVQLKAQEEEHDWEDCIFAENVFVETGLFMGLTAHTGQLTDNHDVHGITVRNLDQEAEFIDSEMHFAQFSKFTVAESLSRIQSDIRGALYETAAAGSKPKQAEAPSSYDNYVVKQLVNLNRDIQLIASSIQQQQLQTSVHAAARGQGVGGISEREMDQMLSPVTSSSHVMKAVSNDLRRGVGDLSGETKKLHQIFGKLENLIKKVEANERSETGAQMYEERKMKEDYENSSLFSLWNIMFFLLCIVCAYLAFTLFRAKKGKGHRHV